MTSFKEVKVREDFLSPNEVDYIRRFETAVLGHKINLKGGVVLRLNKQSRADVSGECVCIKLQGLFVQDCSDRSLLWSLYLRTLPF